MLELFIKLIVNLCHLEYSSFHMLCIKIRTVYPLYSERGYSEHPLIVNGFLRTDR
jgi:hypothetical protein